MQDFLRTIGATLSASGDAHFAATPLTSLLDTTVIVPLSHLGLVGVKGPDSAKFLQGQITCDVQEAGPDRFVQGAYCSPKGRVLASFYLAQAQPDSYWLRLRRDIQASTQASLAKYVVFSKAKIAAEEDLIGLGLHGPAARSVVATLTGSAAAAGTAGSAIPVEGGLVLQLDDAGSWFECWLSREQAQALWQGQVGKLTPAGGDFWRCLSVRAGLAEISAATVDLFIPQMLNLQLTGAISFKKGCYTGQEIVARTQYRGQIKRHLYRLECPLPAPLAGAELEGPNGQKIGSVVDRVAINATRAELLAVMSANDAAELGANATTVRLLDLPYAIT